MDHRANFPASYAALLDAERPDAHPADSELIAYHQGALPPADRDRLRDHLVACRTCFALLRDLGPFTAAARQAPAAPAELEAAALWRALQPRLTAEPPARPTAPRGPILAAMAATFAVTALGFSAWMASRQPPRPQANAAIHDLVEDASERTGEADGATEVALDAGAVLILTPDPGLDDAAYRVTILDAAGATVSAVDGLQPDPRDETFTLWLPPGSLPPGVYRLELRGGGGDPGSYQLIAGYRIRIAPGRPPS